MRKYLIGLLIIVVVNVAQAQDSVKYSTLSFGVGVNNIADKDLFQSPYTYRGTNFLLNASYTRTGIKGQHIVELNYSGGKLSSIVAPQADNQLLMFNYAYLFKLRPDNTNAKLIPSLGVGLHTLMRTMNYLPKVEAPKKYLTAGSYLTLLGNIAYNFNEKNSVKIQAALPVVGLVYRPDFDVNGKSQTSFTRIGKSGLFSADLEYNYKLSPRLHLRAAYTYTYFTFDDPRPVTILRNGFTVGLRRAF